MDSEQHIELTPSQEVPSSREDVKIDRMMVAEGSSEPRVSPWRESLERFARDKRAMGALIVIGTMFLGSFILLPMYEHIGPVIALKHGFVRAGPELYHTPTFLDSEHIHAPWSGMHWLGTDDQGANPQCDPGIRHRLGRGRGSA
jgi:N-terminal TM domain of oligopeptide transport permease C